MLKKNGLPGLALFADDVTEAKLATLQALLPRYLKEAASLFSSARRSNSDGEPTMRRLDDAQIEERQESAKWFVGKDFTIAHPQCKVLRSQIIFGYPLKGFTYEQDQGKQDALFEAWTGTLIPMLNQASDDELRVLYTGLGITLYEIKSILKWDLSYALIGLCLVFVLMCRNLGSVFLATFGMIGILVSFPATYLLYGATGHKYMGLLNFLVAFLMLGVGCDDIFVFYASWHAQKNHAKRNGLWTTLWKAWLDASGAICITSITTAAAFLCNLMAYLPALREFGLFMALSVGVNLVLSVTLFPAAIAFHEVYDPTATP